MRIRNLLVSLSILTVLAGLNPVTAVTYGDDPASRYDRCITKAERSLHACLDHAVATETLCWSRYGYAKLWCSLRYAVDSIAT
jgi:hypothetical protein